MGSSDHAWKSLAAPVGNAMKSTAASTKAMAIVPASSLSESCSSSSPAIFADHESERMPMTRDSTSATVPRRKGFLKTGKRSEKDRTSFDSTEILPSGVRTAVAERPGPRIITPSMTACPPTMSFSSKEFPPP